MRVGGHALISSGWRAGFWGCGGACPCRGARGPPHSRECGGGGSSVLQRVVGHALISSGWCAGPVGRGVGAGAGGCGEGGRGGAGTDAAGLGPVQLRKNPILLRVFGETLGKTLYFVGETLERRWKDVVNLPKDVSQL